MSVTALSWSVALLSGEVYFDLSDMLKDKDCQFSCTDKNMSIDSTNTGWGEKSQTKPLSGVHHCSPCKTPRRRWHLTCFWTKYKNLADLRPVSFYVCVLAILCHCADSVLGRSL